MCRKDRLITAAIERIVGLFFTTIVQGYSLFEVGGTKVKIFIENFLRIIITNSLNLFTAHSLESLAKRVSGAKTINSSVLLISSDRMNVVDESEFFKVDGEL